ncbi:MAG: BREX system ATP-binding domain-containing protein [Syntrophomonadaceae bacterium]
MGLRAGMKVLVKRLGEAIIVKLTGDGALVSLLAADGLQVKQPYDNIQVLEDTVESVEQPEARRSEIDLDQFEQSKALEALRFGLVPESCLPMLTVGYEDLVQWIEACMPYSNGQVCRIHEVCGPFGTGKSHTMALVRQIALEKNYLVARIEADGKSVNLAAPQRLLYNIWLSIEGHDLNRDMPLLDLYLKVLQKGYDSIPQPLKDVEIMAQNFTFIKKLKDAQTIDDCVAIIEDALAGNETVTGTQIKADLAHHSGLRRNQITFRPMIFRGWQDRLTMFVLSLAGHALLARAAGYRGIVLTIDEFEIHHNMPAADQAKVRDLIKRLDEYVNHNIPVPQAPLAIFFGAVSQAGQKGDPWIESLISDSQGKQYYLTSWSDSQKQQLANSIYKLYKKVYELPEDYSPELTLKTENLLESRDQTDLVRAFIKYYMAVLDVEYGPGRLKACAN